MKIKKNDTFCKRSKKMKNKTAERNKRKLKFKKKEVSEK